jgi:hypothetical protein
MIIVVHACTDEEKLGQLLAAGAEQTCLDFHCHDRVLQLAGEGHLV